MCKGPILLYTILLLFFGTFRMQTNEDSMQFEADKPDLLIVNQGENEGITKDFIEYLSHNCIIKEIDSSDDALNDALFYRDVNYIVFIPKEFRESLLHHTPFKVQVKSTGDYEASLAQMIVTRYIKVASFYTSFAYSEEEVIRHVHEVIDQKMNVEVLSQIDTFELSKATYYYNFMNYSFLAGCVYVVSLILSSFRESTISKRTRISSMKPQKFNRHLLLANGFFVFGLWLFYVLIGACFFQDVMIQMHGLFYLLNSFLFGFCALTIAFLIGSLVQNKNAINGIINVVALGSSFLCGAFVPMEWLPDNVLKIAHFLPSYWYIKTNEILKTIEIFSFDTLKEVYWNMGMLIFFSIFFLFLTNFITKKKKIES